MPSFRLYIRATERVVISGPRAGVVLDAVFWAGILRAARRLMKPGSPGILVITSMTGFGLPRKLAL